jgi:hypothetical protein
MRRAIVCSGFILIAALCSCSRKDTTDSTASSSQPPAAAEQAAAPAAGPHAVVLLKSGGRVPGTIVASSQTDLVVLGDDQIEHKIPLAQVQSVQYSDAPAEPARQASNRPAAKPAPREDRPPLAASKSEPAQTAQQQPSAPIIAPAPASPQPKRSAVTTKTYELPPGSEISVRTNEAIDSATATEGQTFDAQVTRDATDAAGDVVIPRGADARIVIRSASKGGKIQGQSDLVLDLQSITINGKEYALTTSDMTKQGKEGIGANRRTGVYTGGGAAIGAIIGAIAGGGKGAAIGAGAGAGAGALAQILTRGGSIKVPAESVLTFRLDQPLKVTAQ